MLSQYIWEHGTKHRERFFERVSEVFPGYFYKLACPHLVKLGRISQRDYLLIFDKIIVKKIKQTRHGMMASRLRLKVVFISVLRRPLPNYLPTNNRSKSQSKSCPTLKQTIPSSAMRRGLLLVNGNTAFDVGKEAHHHWHVK